MDLSQIPEWLFTALAILGVLAIIFGPSAIVARWEKRMVWPYTTPGKIEGSGEPDDGYDEFFHAPRPSGMPDYKANPTPFTIRENAMAALLGFRPAGYFMHGKGGIYRIRYDFWRSEGGDVLALVGSGTLAGIPVLNTWLYSNTTDGRCLITLGKQDASEIDLGGLAVESLLVGADFERLLDWHRARIAGQPIAPFSEDSPLDDHLDYRRRRTDRLVERGDAFYIDPTRTTWRYTLKGALMLSFRAITQGVRRVVLPDRLLRRFKAARQA
jgi:hypothetical protein